MNPKVYRIRYSYEHHERIATCGGMDSEPTGRVLRDEADTYVLSSSEAVARSAFLGDVDIGRRIVSVSEVCPVNLIALPYFPR